MKEQKPTVTPLLICTDFSFTGRLTGMLHVLRGSVCAQWQGWW
jgi:hypothetical protein